MFRNREVIRALWLAAAVVHVGWQVVFWIPARMRSPETTWDAYDYYLSAARVRSHEPLYRPWPDYGPDVMTPGHPYPKSRFPYPPPFAALLAPLSAMPEPAFVRFWTLLLVAAFWIYAGALSRIAIGRVTVPGVLCSGLVIAAVPQAYLALSFGNVDPLLWALFGVALATPARGEAFAASALVKLYAGWPLALASLREGRRILVPAAAVLMVGLVIGAAACGARSWVDWARDYLPVLGQGTFNPGNLSLSFAGLRIARWAGWSYLGGPLPGPARLYLAGMSAGGPLSAAYLSRRQSREVQYGVVAVAALLFGPLCWPYYLALALAPAAAVGRELSRKSRNCGDSRDAGRGRR